MGKILVRKQQTGLAPEIAGGAERSGSQLFTGQGGIQSFIDPSRRDLSEMEGSTLGVYPSHFTHPDTGQVHEHPLAGQAIINPNAGQSKYGKLKPAMWGSRALGAGLGAYSAMMSFAGDDDQDALSSGLNALGAGYNSYAATAPIEQMMGRVADRGQAQRASDISTREGVANISAIPQPVGRAYQNLPSAAWPSRGTTGSQPSNPFPTPPSYTSSGHVIPKVETESVTTIPRKEVDIPKVELEDSDTTNSTETSTEKKLEEMSDYERNEFLRLRGFNYKEGENPFG